MFIFVPVDVTITVYLIDVLFLKEQNYEASYSIRYLFW